MRTPPLLLALVLPVAGCGASDPCSTNPAAASCLGTCPGECVPDFPPGPGLMVLVWSGPEGATPPACPSLTPEGATGYLDTPPATVTCSPPCACAPSVG